MRKLKDLKEIFEDNLDGYDVALAIIGSLIGVIFGNIDFLVFYLEIKELMNNVRSVVAIETTAGNQRDVNCV